MRVVLATHNRNKLTELRAILSGTGIDLALLPEDAPAPVEDGRTFEENALLKAESAAAFTSLPAIADDSGLCVDALDGEPGLYSARFGTREYFERKGQSPPANSLPDTASDADRIRYLLRLMADVPPEKRTAHFVCAIACVLQNGSHFTVRGECAGVILAEPRGSSGFGYDPVFFVPEHGKTFGELPAEIKNGLSHRARALRAFREEIQKRIIQ